ncbi:MAG: hypothetical protein JWO03_3957 [Bacteroidetes bacterium]|nr:hypothetical protein [Bacteroidota bacterium]
MKRILLTALSVTALISLSQAQTTTPTPTGKPGGLQINTHGQKPKTTTPSKSSTGTGTTTTPTKGGMPTGGGTSTTSGGKGGGMGNGTGSTTGSTGSSTSNGGKGGGMGDGTGTGSPGNSGGGAVVNPSDASNAVTQLLSAGVRAAVSKVGVTDGYFGNPEIKIPLPPALQQVGSMLTNYGAGALVNELTLQLNRSAEQSATLATPIFINSLTQITPNDAVNIITGSQQDAATQFLKRTTTEQLVVAFKPQVKKVLDATQTSNAYEKVMNLYNRIPFVSPVSADLPDYVTRKALDGLFIMVSKEEAKIRQNPAAAGSSILSKVLGSILGGQGVAAKRK